MVLELTSDNLDEIVTAHEHVVVQYSAGWCGNCRLMKPKFKKFSQEYGTSTFVLADAEQFPESRKLANVDNLPTFAVFQSGNLVGQVQTNKAEILKKLIDEVAGN